LHLTNGVQLQGTWDLSHRNVLIAGADVWGRKLHTERTKHIRVDILNPMGDIVRTNIVERGETPFPIRVLIAPEYFFKTKRVFWMTS